MITKDYLEKQLEKIINIAKSVRDDITSSHIDVVTLCNDLTDFKKDFEQLEINEWNPVEYNWDLYFGYGGKKLPKDGETVIVTIGTYYVTEAIYREGAKEYEYKYSDKIQGKMFFYIDGDGLEQSTTRVRAWKHKPTAYKISSDENDLEQDDTDNEQSNIVRVPIENKRTHILNKLDKKRKTIIGIYMIIFIIVSVIMVVSAFFNKM